jgi:hypothetical protein
MTDQENRIERIARLRAQSEELLARPIDMLPDDVLRDLQRRESRDREQRRERRRVRFRSVSKKRGR